MHINPGANYHPQFYAHPQAPAPLPAFVPLHRPSEYQQHYHHKMHPHFHHRVHHHHRPEFKHEKHGLISSPYPLYLHEQQLDNSPESTQPREVMDKFRTFADESDARGHIEPNEQHRFRSAYDVNPSPYPVPQYPNQYEVKTPTRPAYFPSYEAQYKPKSSCGSNLLIGCQPHVQAVPCYQSQSYGPSPAHNYGYKQPSAPTYPAPHFNVPPPDVYSKPGPPYLYPDTIVSSARSSADSQDRIQFGEESSNKTIDNVQQGDSKPESSNIERKTDEVDDSTQSLVNQSNTGRYEEVTEEQMAEQTTETKIATSTTTTTTTPAPVLGPSTQDQIRKFHEKIENHVENLKKFKEVAGKKLRDAIERSNSRSAADDLDDDFDDFMGRPSFAKRQSVKSVNRDYAYNNAV